MAYDKTTWVSGDPIASAKLNKLEDGVAALSEDNQVLRKEMAALQRGQTNAAEIANAYAALEQHDRQIAASESRVEALDEREAEHYTEQAEAIRNIQQAQKYDPEIPGLYAEMDRLDARISQEKAELQADVDGKLDRDEYFLRDEVSKVPLYEGLEQVNRRVDTKRDIWPDEQLAAVYTETDRIDRRVDGKQDITPGTELGLALAETDRVERITEQKLDKLEYEARNATTTGYLMAETERLSDEVAEKVAYDEQQANDIGQHGRILTEIDQLDRATKVNTINISANLSRIADVQQAASQKVARPSASPYGNEGQILQTNGDGTTTWIDPPISDAAKIGEAVAAWLDEHPEATTTVEDGSITLDKLSQEVIDSMGNSEEVADALATIHGVFSDVTMKLQDNREQRRFIDMFQQHRERLMTYSERFLGTDGIGFLYFTDPHWSCESSYNKTPEYMLRGLEKIRNLYDMTPARYVLCGGDWLNEGYDPGEYMMLLGRVPHLLKDRICQNAYTVTGNHDVVYGHHGYHELTEAQVARLWYDTDVGYYTIPTSDTTCYMFDSGGHSPAMTSYRWTQVDWFCRSLLSNAKRHLFGVCHIPDVPYTDPSGDAQKELIRNLCAAANAFNNRGNITLNGQTYRFGTCTGTFHFILSGHTHSDSNMTTNGIPVIVTCSYLRDEAVDGVYADFAAAKLYMTRFGGGSDREIDIIPNN